MDQQFEETEYNTLTKNVKFFKRTQKLYNAILDSGCNDRIAELSNIVNEILDFRDELVADEASRSDVSEMQRQLYITYFTVIQTIVLQVTDEKPDTESDLEAVAKYVASKTFRRWILRYQHREVVLAAYSLLLDAKRDNPSVREAFQEVNAYLRKFFENDDEHVKEDLAQAVHKLLKVCMENTDDEDNCQETLMEFTFEKMHTCLWKDMVYGSVKHREMKYFFNMCKNFNEQV